MTKRMLKGMRYGVAALSLALAAPALMLPMPMAAYAQSQDVLVENVELGPIKIGKIELTGTNATQEQVEQLVSGQMPPPDMQAFIKGLDAESITISDVAVAPPEGGSLEVGSVEIEGLSAASGKLDSLKISGVNAAEIPSPTGPVSISVEEASLTGVEAADSSRRWKRARLMQCCRIRKSSRNLKHSA